MLWTSYIPIIVKYSIIIVILKPNKLKNKIQFYRPISLLPTHSKLFEKIIRLKIRLIHQTYNKIPYSQFMFRKNHCSIRQIHKQAEFMTYFI